MTGLELSKNIDISLDCLKDLCGGSADINISRLTAAGVRCAVVTAEGMASLMMIGDLVFEPLNALAEEREMAPEELMKRLSRGRAMSTDCQRTASLGRLMRLVFSGFAAVLIDGCGEALLLGIQGYEKRSVSVSENEQSVGGAHDSFTEALHTNMSLVRRRLKTPLLRFETLETGRLSHTETALVYLSDRVPEETVAEVRRRLGDVGLDTVLTEGYVAPYLDESYDRAVFSGTVTTERPDQLCAYLNEGRVCVMVDGTPACTVVPALFSDSFRTMDDMCTKGPYAAFQRWLKYLCFILATVLPGLYAAMVTFHPEVFSLKLLLNLAAAEEATPYPLTAELLLLMVMFEIMREAGVRLPKAVGGAVSIVGGLIIGETAVKSGLISEPLLIVVGVTATASFALPKLYEPVSVLRLLFILAGGCAGLFGIALGSVVLLTNIAAMNELAVSFTSPLTPLEPAAVGDVAARRSFRSYQRTRTAVTDL